MVISKENNDCMVRAITLALDKPELSDVLWPIRKSQMESGQAVSTEPEMEAVNLARLFQAAGEQGTVIPLTVKSLKDIAVFQRGDQIFVGLPKKVAGEPHIMYVGQSGDRNVLSRELIELQLPAEIASRFIFDLIGLAISKDGLQTFIRRS